MQAMQASPLGEPFWIAKHVEAAPEEENDEQRATA